MVIVLMSSVHETLQMEDWLEEADIRFRSVVKPRSLGTDCGIAIRINISAIPDVITGADKTGSTIHGIFRQQDNRWVPHESSSD